MNVANTAFGAVAGEDFAVTSTGPGNPGTYTAISIDDLVSGLALSPGGLKGDNTVNIFISRDTRTASGIKDGSVLSARGRRVRVISIHDEGDNTIMLACASAGITLK